MIDQPPAIKSLRVRSLIVPLPLSHKTASGTVAESPLVLVDITNTGDTTGRRLILTCASTVH